jgi:hypothetical protein
MIPTYLEDGCQNPIENCEVDSTNYATNGAHFVCPVCQFGYFAKGTHCAPCEISGCLDCSQKDICLICEDTTKILSPTASACVSAISGCIDDTDNYGVLGSDWICLHCSGGKVWNNGTNLCDTCKNVFGS